MAFDKAMVTERLPDLWADPGPLPDEGDAAMYYVERLAAITRDYVGALHDLSWWEAAFAGIGVMATLLVGYCCIAYAWESWRDNRRRDRLACDLVRRAWSELSPADIAEAEERWPIQFALARFIIERNHASPIGRAKARLDAWFTAERAEAAERESAQRMVQLALGLEEVT